MQKCERLDVECIQIGNERRGRIGRVAQLECVCVHLSTHYPKCSSDVAERKFCTHSRRAIHVTDWNTQYTHSMKAPQVKRSKRCVTNYSLPPICHWLHGQRLVSLICSCFLAHILLSQAAQFHSSGQSRHHFQRMPNVCDCNLLIFFMLRWLR